MANNCNTSCASSCSNLCDNVCTYVCKNVCTSACESMCGDSCSETCIAKCSGTEMSITSITTFYDRSYGRKVTKLTNRSNNGYLIYPGLNGKITVFKVINNFLMGKLATSVYNPALHNSNEVYKIEPLATEDSEHMVFVESGYMGPNREQSWNYLLYDSSLGDNEKRINSFSILQIQRVVYDALMRSVRENTEPITLEDVLYLIYNDPTMRKLYYDIQNWSWNNGDTFYHNLIKKSSDPEISRS